MLGATRVELTYGGATIRKESDVSIVPSSLLPACTDPDQSGLVVFEGAVFNESTSCVVTELLFWLAGARCKVSVMSCRGQASGGVLKYTQKPTGTFR